MPVGPQFGLIWTVQHWQIHKQSGGAAEAPAGSHMQQLPATLMKPCGDLRGCTRLQSEYNWGLMQFNRSIVHFAWSLPAEMKFYTLGQGPKCGHDPPIPLHHFLHEHPSFFWRLLWHKSRILVKPSAGPHQTTLFRVNQHPGLRLLCFVPELLQDRDWLIAHADSEHMEHCLRLFACA